MNVSRLLLAPTLICSAMPAVADETKPTVDFFALVNVSFQSTDDGDGRFTETKSNNSRVGVKGTYDLDDGLKAIYHLEWKVDVTGQSAGDNLSSRNQYIGLQGDFGTFLVGRNDTVLKQTQGKIDLFNHKEMDLGKLWKGENRPANTVTYFSPKIGEFRFGATYLTETSADQDSATSLSVTYGDKSLKSTGLYAAVGADFDLNGYDTIRTSVSTKVAGVTLGAIYQHQENVESGVTESGMLVSAAYQVEKLVYKAQLQTLEDDKMLSVGLDYKIRKNTLLYAFYGKRDNDTKEDSDWLALGMEQKF